VTRLAERLENNPDDAEGWFMLGRSYMVLKRYAEAADAFARLRGLVGDAPDVLLREATALAMAKGGRLAGRPIELVRRALDQQPDHAQALWMAATAAYQAGRNREALDYYRRVEPKLEGEARTQVRSMIDQLTGSESGPQTGETSGQASDSQAGQAGGDVRTDEAAASVQVSVALAPQLRDRAGPNDTVFVFAKAVDGPQMPLAVVRPTVAALPASVVLDDSQAMMPQLRLSAYDRVTIGARVSGSGEVAARPGDLEGESRSISPTAAETVEVTIDRVVSGN